LTSFQRPTESSPLLLALFLGALYFMLGLRCGFRANRDTTIRVEDALGLFDPGVYLDDRSVLPAAYHTTEDNGHKGHTRGARTHAFPGGHPFFLTAPPVGCIILV